MPDLNAIGIMYAAQYLSKLFSVAFFIRKEILGKKGLSYN